MSAGCPNKALDAGVLKDRVEALEPHATPPGPDFLDWVADRLVNVSGEDENVDFVLALRRKAAKARAVLAKLGRQP